MTSLKIFFSIESSFRIFQCGLTQPLKVLSFMYGWQPSWLIHVAKFVGDFFRNYTFIGTDRVDRGDGWLTREVICSIPVSLDIASNFGTGIFIVMCNAAR